MPRKSKEHRQLPMANRQSKASVAVGVQSQYEVVCENIRSLRDTAATLLASEKPTKRARKEILDTANAFLSLQ